MTYFVLQGTFYNLNSITLVNQRLADGLERLGYKVYRAPTDRREQIDLGRQPDIFLTHDYPYDVSLTPGKLNVMLLNYEYPEFMPQDRYITEGINRSFDLLITPSEFSRKACLNSGVRVPIEVCGYGFDPLEFHPEVLPHPLETEKAFRFLNLGGAFDRKGTDILLRAYVEEFSADEDVVLVIKAFSYPNWRDWIDALLSEVSRGDDTPEILFEHSEPDSVAGYYAAADVGVFPFRGEGFGLTILECLACGTPVIVTQGGSVDDFCTPENASFIESGIATTNGFVHLEPEVDSLRQQMRQAFERGKTTPAVRTRIHHTVAHITWDHAISKYKAVFDRWQETAVTPSLPVSFTSELWNRDVHFLQDILPYSDRSNSVQAVTGLAGYSAGLFFKAPPGTKKILLHDGAPLPVRMAHDEMAWIQAGLPSLNPRRYASFKLWQYRMEYRHADYLLTCDPISAEHLSAHFGAEKIGVLPPVFPHNPLLAPPSNKPLTFVFIGVDPFRRGILTLFEAWIEAALPEGRLLCLLEDSAYASPRLLKMLVKAPTIEVHHLKLLDDYAHIFAEADVQVVPAVEDGIFSPASIGMSYGVPAVVSASAALSTVVTHGVDGYIASGTSVGVWADMLREVYDQRDRLNALRQACYDTVQQYSPERFQIALSEWVTTHAL